MPHNGQCERLTEWLRNPFHETITRLEAAKELGIFELAARINELERRGFRFRKERITVENRWLETVRCARYSIAFDPAEQPAAVRG